MKIAETCQGDTLANLDQEGPNVKKQQKYVMQTVKHASAKIRDLALGLFCCHRMTVCLSHAGIVWKRIKISSNFFSRSCSPTTMVF